jgi:hypothetical protein
MEEMPHSSTYFYITALDGDERKDLRIYGGQTTKHSCWIGALVAFSARAAVEGKNTYFQHSEFKNFSWVVHSTG